MYWQFESDCLLRARNAENDGLRRVQGRLQFGKGEDLLAVERCDDIPNFNQVQL